MHNPPLSEDSFPPIRTPKDTTSPSKIREWQHLQRLANEIEASLRTDGDGSIDIATLGVCYLALLRFCLLLRRRRDRYNKRIQIAAAVVFPLLVLAGFYVWLIMQAKLVPVFITTMNLTITLLSVLLVTLIALGVAAIANHKLTRQRLEQSTVRLIERCESKFKSVCGLSNRVIDNLHAEHLGNWKLMSLAEREFELMLRNSGMSKQGMEGLPPKYKKWITIRRGHDGEYFFRWDEPVVHYLTHNKLVARDFAEHLLGVTTAIGAISRKSEIDELAKDLQRVARLLEFIVVDEEFCELRTVAPELGRAVARKMTPQASSLNGCERDEHQNGVVDSDVADDVGVIELPDTPNNDMSTDLGAGESVDGLAVTRNKGGVPRGGGEVFQELESGKRFRLNKGWLDGAVDKGASSGPHGRLEGEGERKRGEAGDRGRGKNRKRRMRGGRGKVRESRVANEVNHPHVVVSGLLDNSPGINR